MLSQRTTAKAFRIASHCSAVVFVASALLGCAQSPSGGHSGDAPGAIARTIEYTPPTLPDAALESVEAAESLADSGEAEQALRAYQELNQRHPSDLGLLAGLVVAANEAGEYQIVLDATLEMFLLEPTTVGDTDLLALRQRAAAAATRQSLDQFRNWTPPDPREAVRRAREAVRGAVESDRVAVGADLPPFEHLASAHHSLASGLAIPGNPQDEFVLASLLVEYLEIGDAAKSGHFGESWEYIRVLARALFDDIVERDPSLRMSTATERQLGAESVAQLRAHGLFWSPDAGDHVRSVRAGPSLSERVVLERRWLREQVERHRTGDLAGTVRWGCALLSGIGTLRDDTIGDAAVTSATASRDLPQAWKATALYWSATRRSDYGLSAWGGERHASGREVKGGFPFPAEKLMKLALACELGEPAACVLIHNHRLCVAIQEVGGWSSQKQRYWQSVAESADRRLPRGGVPLDVLGITSYIQGSLPSFGDVEVRDDSGNFWFYNLFLDQESSSFGSAGLFPNMNVNTERFDWRSREPFNRTLAQYKRQLSIAIEGLEQRKREQDRQMDVIFLDDPAVKLNEYLRIQSILGGR